MFTTVMIKVLLSMLTFRSIIIVSIAFILLTACTEKTPVHLAPDEIALVVGNPVDYGSKDYLLFPVGGNYNPEMNEPTEQNNITKGRGFEGSASSNQLNLQLRDESNNVSYMWDKLAKYEYGNEDETSFDIRNLLFYNKNTGETYPLVEDTIHILSFAFHYEFKKPLVFYRVVKKDINKDHKYNSKDAVMLYMSDTMGKNFTQITPPNEQVLTYFYYPETQKILVKTAIDIDNNHKFTTSDETNFREVNLAKPSLGRPIFSDSLKASLKNLMF
jgi:hypothetical protein